MLADHLAQFFKNNTTISNQTDYAVGVSGGPDSMALTHALLENYPDKKFHILTVDHGLRAEAQEEAQKVLDFCKPYKNATHCSLTWEGKKPKNAVLEKARNARYSLMYKYCDDHGIKTVFIGHHQDDQAETFLIRLSKGSGLDGLASMIPLSKRNEIYMARPFLSVSKEEIISYCKGNKIGYINDPTNENKDYLRPRLRESMFVLEKEGLTAKRLSVTASRLNRARDALVFYAEDIFSKAVTVQDTEKVTLDFSVLQKAPSEISLRIIQNLIEAKRMDYDYNVRMEKLEDLHHSLFSEPENFKPRTLGGCIISLKKSLLTIEKEKK